MEKSIEYLLNNGWLSKSEDTSCKVYQLHELIQDGFKKVTNTEERRAIRDRLIGLLDTELPNEICDLLKMDRRVLTSLNCHFERFLEFSHELKDNTQFLKLLDKSINLLVKVLHDADKTVKLLVFIERCLPPSSKTASLLVDMGKLCFEQNHLDKSLLYYTSALDKLKQSESPLLYSLTESINRNLKANVNKEESNIELNFASLFKSVDCTNTDVLLGFEDSKQILDGILRIKKHMLVVDHPHIAITHAHLGFIYQNERNYQKACLNYDQAIMVYSDYPLAKQHFIADLLINSGICYMEMFKYLKILLY